MSDQDGLLWLTLDGLQASYLQIAEQHRREAASLTGEARAFLLNRANCFDVAANAVEIARRAVRNVLAETKEIRGHVTH